MKALHKKIKKLVNGKLLASGALGAMALFLLSTHSAHADGGVAGSVINAIGNAVIGKVTYAIGYIIAALGGILVAVEAWLITVALNVNANVFQSSVVQNGFSISLAVANLAFVLGIIVIAIATILRRESYGIKQLLWKLAVMAILVNFGLVIMAPIFGMANNMTQYFLNCVSPTAGGCSGTGSGLSSYNTFATTLVGAFNPQDSFLALTRSGSELQSSTSTSALNVTSGANGSFSISATLVQQIIPIFGIVFLVINMGLICIVLATFFVLLIIRYLYIAILAILLPFAWAAWVFPSFSYHFEAWWKKFLQWTFFAPIVMFFIYLALQAMATGGSFSTVVSTYAGSGNGMWGAIASFLTGGFSVVVQAFLQEILLAGLIIGGLIAANEMGIKAAGAAVNGAKAGAKAGAVWTTKRTARAGLTAASRVMQPKPRIDPATGNPYTPLTRMNRIRGAASTWFQGKASSSSLATKKGLANTVFSAGIKGSGLFKDFSGAHKKKEYECENCGNVIASTKKPTRACNVCGTNHWVEVAED